MKKCPHCEESINLTYWMVPTSWVRWTQYRCFVCHHYSRIPILDCLFLIGLPLVAIPAIFNLLIGPCFRGDSYWLASLVFIFITLLTISVLMATFAHFNAVLDSIDES